MNLQAYAKALAGLRDENIRSDRTAPGGCATARERAAAYRMALSLLHDETDGEFGEKLEDQPTPYEVAR